MSSEIPARVVGEESDGTPILARVMSADEIRERAALNVERTTQYLRARVETQVVQTNGWMER